MITTTYTCDDCGHEQDTPEQMWHIGVALRHHGTKNNSYEKPREEELWCRNCVEKLGLLPTPKEQKSEEPAPEPMSLEDMIRDIIHEEVSSQAREN